MAEQSDVVMAYVLHNWGRAAAMLAYAQKKGKRIVRFIPASSETN